MRNSHEYKMAKASIKPIENDQLFIKESKSQVYFRHNSVCNRQEQFNNIYIQPIRSIST